MLPREPGAWHAVIGEARSFLVEDDGHAVAFDRPSGAEPPLAVRIAADEAGALGAKPRRLHVLVEPGLALPDSALWSERAGVAVSVEAGRPPLVAPAAAGAIDLLAGDFARPGAAAGSLRQIHDIDRARLRSLEFRAYALAEGGIEAIRASDDPILQQFLSGSIEGPLTLGPSSAEFYAALLNL